MSRKKTRLKNTANADARLVSAEAERDPADVVPTEKNIAQRRTRDGVRLSKKEKKEVPVTPLTESLDALTMDDFSVKVKRKKTSRGFTATQWIALFVCVGIFAYSAYQVAYNLFEYAEAKRQYDDLKELFYAPLSADDSLPEPLPAASTPDWQAAMDAHAAGKDIDDLYYGENDTGESFQTVLARLTKLKSLNSDTYGWIKLTGTEIDYPVVQGDNNDYYLRRSFYKSYLNSGSIFADAACLSPSQNRNTVIYGHNMKDGTMFHTLHNLANPEYFESAEIRLMTTEGIFVYEVYSVHRPHETDRFFHTDFTEASWLEFISWTKAQSLIDNSAISVTAEDRVITLSTCISTTTEEPYRFVVHGVLRKVIIT